MKKESSIKLFEEKKIRSVWNDEEEEWYFSVVDVIGVLTDSFHNPNLCLLFCKLILGLDNSYTCPAVQQGEGNRFIAWLA